MQSPTPADITRYRYQYGANLGSVFILERWLSGSMFHETAKGSSELAAVETWIKVEGIDKARLRFETHWKTYVSDSDLDWLRDIARCTTVRLPIGYFTLGPQFCVNTAFKNVSPVYQNAWPAVKDFVSRCAARGIGVLIDLHGLPGGANAEIHSGTDSGKAELWGNRVNLDLATKCVCFIAQQAHAMDGVVGIQIVNEAVTGANGMYDWYERVLSELSPADITIPVYISDAWSLNQALQWIQTKNSARAAASNPVVIDTHLYFCFADQDKQKSPQQITSGIPTTLVELDGEDGNVVDRGAAQVFVGEYSCVLADYSWAKSQNTQRQQLVCDFGGAQSQRYQSRAGGSTFWTYKMDWMNGGEWGFRQMIEQHSVTTPTFLTLLSSDVHNRISQAQGQEDQRRTTAVTAHCQYWDTTYPGHYEHWRFEQGWKVGFSDATAFFEARSQRGLQGGDKIGMLDLWCLKRIRDCGQVVAFTWEFEQGLRQGVRDFYECVGV